MNIKDFASAAAKTVAGKAVDVIDTNRDQLVADFEQAVARQRVEFIREAAALTTRITRSALIAASIISIGLVVHALAYFLHR